MELRGFEPLASALRVQRSPSLSYNPETRCSSIKLPGPCVDPTGVEPDLPAWSYAGLNRGPLACHASALPAELQPQALTSTRSWTVPAGGVNTGVNRLLASPGEGVLLARCLVQERLRAPSL